MQTLTSSRRYVDLLSNLVVQEGGAMRLLLALALVLPATVVTAAGPACDGNNAMPVLSYGAAASPSAHIIDSVPAYSWYHGCGPTAAGSIIGYWGLHGYPNLFNASGQNVFLTQNVQDEISSPQHNAKYHPTPDALGPVPAFTSIADWFRTSVDPLGFGSSYLIPYARDAFIGYASYRGYHSMPKDRISLDSGMGCFGIRN